MMKRRILAAIALVAALPAQTVREQFALVGREVAAQRWQTALDLLLPLPDQTADAGERQEIAARLEEVGGALSQAGDGSLALAALEAARYASSRRRNHATVHASRSPQCDT